MSLPTASNTPANPIAQPHLVSLVLQSKKALQHGEQLCTRAHVASNASAQAAVDVLALDAKVRWISEAVIEQLRLAASVAKSIEEKRAYLGKKIDEWDTARAKHTDALDDILEALGAQLVPPDFHQTSADSSLFGSQNLSAEEPKEDPSLNNIDKINENRNSPTTPLRSASRHSTYSGNLSLSPVSPSSTLRRNGYACKESEHERGRGKTTQPITSKGKINEDRKNWKTLRDFVDDQAIEDIHEMIDQDRVALGKIFSETDEYPERLTGSINSIQTSLPISESRDDPTLKKVQDAITRQETNVTSMAGMLVNLASHYDQMAGALKDTESGEVLSEGEMWTMNRDTEELPRIMADMERHSHNIESDHERLKGAREELKGDLDHLSSVLDNLDELGDIMGLMLTTQDSIEVKAEDSLDILYHHLLTLEHLHERYVAYRMAFNKLILEIGRRRQYREAAENIVKGMMKQLDSMTEEENRVRSHFNAEYGLHLPEDLCLCIGNSPTRWEVVPCEGSSLEVLPSLDADLIGDARERVGITEPSIGAESL
ncbi:hypothetical protein BYT27DRAFT_7180774 [Phlegmacium glaucopus]|nr:hypothetical protein BYT27DRAFT_7180774 [Phlegmacium glaucopus]